MRNNCHTYNWRFAISSKRCCSILHIENHFKPTLNKTHHIHTHRILKYKLTFSSYQISNTHIHIHTQQTPFNRHTHTHKHSYTIFHPTNRLHWKTNTYKQTTYQSDPTTKTDAVLCLRTATEVFIRTIKTLKSQIKRERNLFLCISHAQIFKAIFRCDPFTNNA